MRKPHYEGTSSAEELWLKTGYEAFAYQGPDALLVERLARAVGINKSSFYHFFGDRDLYIDALLRYHLSCAHDLGAELERITHFEQEFPLIQNKYRMSVLFHAQLVKQREDATMRQTLDRINDYIDPIIVKSFAGYVNLPPDLALDLFRTARDMFYSQVTPQNLDASYIAGVVQEIQRLVANIRAKNPS
jgi:AcrR family transcriptional regulator